MHSVGRYDPAVVLKDIVAADLGVDKDRLGRSDREYEVAGWLEKRGIESGWELAPTLVSLGFDQAELQVLAEDFNASEFPVVAEWLRCTHTIYSLLCEIGLGTSRISEIVKALRNYSYMDQAPIQCVDVHEGLDDTLVILRSKLKSGVTVRKEYDEGLPDIDAYGSELNQVWTNIIDNAIDAMGGRGALVLRTRREDACVVVEIEDNGPGVPEEIQSKLFDPFFTTKPPGEGMGLGLNISRNIIVQKHQGEISLSSQPGRTCFEVRLPINPETLNQG